MKYEIAKDIVVDYEERIGANTIEWAFQQFTARQARFMGLEAYYNGDHPFSDLHSEDTQNRVVANYCAYITKVLTGYMLGHQPRYTTSEGDAKGEEIFALFESQDKWEVESEIAQDCSKYGRAFEIVYTPMDGGEPKSKVISPRNAFVAYCGDLEKDSVFGGVFFRYHDDQRREWYRIYVYDRRDVSVWETLAKDSSPRTWIMRQGPAPHGFGRVPIIEYRNNKECIGDYEGILELQDAYNSLMSDRQDNQDSFSQAMLVLTGTAIGSTPEEIEDGKAILKKHKVLHLDEDSAAAYLTKTTDEAGVQVLADQLASDIHKFAMVPDLSDEQFSGNASGVAMAYKLFGTDQVVSRKHAQMQKGFTRRCKLYDYRINNPTMSPAYEPQADIENMAIEFNLNAPQDLSYMATSVSTLVGCGVMSKETARTIISDIPDPEAEAERVEAEQRASLEATRDTYGSDFADRMRKDDEEDDAPDTEE